MTDRQGATSGVTPVRRFWPVGLIVALVCGVSAAWATERTAETTWVGQGQYIVPIAPALPEPEPDEPPPPVTELPDNAYDAGVLARTYELVLEEDTPLLDALADRIGMDRDDVQGGVDAVHVLGTRVVRVTFQAGTEEAARGYFDELSALLSQESPSPHLPTGNLVPLGEPAEPEVSTGLAGAAPLVGGALGLLLGWAAMLLLDRLDRRVLAAADVRAVAAWPVLDGLAADRDEVYWESVVLRVRHDAQVGSVAVVTAPGARPAVVDDAAVALAAAEQRLVDTGRLDDAQVTRWQLAGRLEDDGLAELEAQTSDAVVLVLPRRTRMSSACAALRALDDLGVSQVLVSLTRAARSSQVRGGGPSADARELHPEPAAQAQRGRPEDAGPEGPGPDGGRELHPSVTSPQR